MISEITGYSVEITAEDLAAIVRSIHHLPKFKHESITLTILDNGDLNILLTKHKEQHDRV